MEQIHGTQDIKTLKGERERKKKMKTHKDRVMPPKIFVAKD